MTPTIIIDFHDPSGGRDALALARSLGELNRARFVTVTSYPRDRYDMLPVLGRPWAMSEETKAAADLARSLAADEPGVVARVIGAPSPAQALQETAEREQADLIVVSAASIEPRAGASSASGRQVMQGAPCAVALAPVGFAQVGDLLVPVGAGFDGSWESRLALASAAGLAVSLGGELRVISALKRPAPAHPMFAFTSYHRHLEQLQEEMRSRLIDAVDTLPVCPEIDPVVLEGEPIDVLADQSRELGLLVVGSRGYGPLRRVLLGSVSDALLGRAECPVMIVPRGVEHGYGSAIISAQPARSH